jgi:hypothetical protein
MLTRDTPTASDALRAAPLPAGGGAAHQRDISQSIRALSTASSHTATKLVVTTLGRNPYLPDCLDSAVSDDNAYPRRSRDTRVIISAHRVGG